MSKPRLLDLFCGAGGAAMGYHRAGFEVVGVDIVDQPHYPFEFHQADALEFIGWAPELIAREYDAIHASPPCQAHSPMRNMPNAKKHIDLIPPTREALLRIGLPFVIENVPGAPLHDPFMLCGSMFRLGIPEAELRRHRLFESNAINPLMVPPCQHGWRRQTVAVYGHAGGYSRRTQAKMIGVYGGHGMPGLSRRRHHPMRPSPQQFNTDARREAMGIDWMTGTELSQAIPPAYTEFIGNQLMRLLSETLGQEDAA